MLDKALNLDLDVHKVRVHDLPLPLGNVTYCCVMACILAFSPAYTLFLLTDLECKFISRKTCFKRMNKCLVTEVLAHATLCFSAYPIFVVTGLGLYYFTLFTDVVLAWNLRKCIFIFVDGSYYPSDSLRDNDPIFIEYLELFAYEAKLKFIVYVVVLFVWVFFFGYNLI